MAATSLKRRRQMALVAAGAAVFVVGSSGVVAALVGGHANPVPSPERLTTVQAETGIEETPGSTMDRIDRPWPAPAVTSSPSADPNALADGTYPTFVHRVNVSGATITVDVIQIFENGEDAVRAAMEDGMSKEEAQTYLYDPVYVRNQNPLLRTLPVARDVRIEFLGTCESPGDRDAALQELRDKTTPFNAFYYYSVTVRDGAVHRVVEHQTGSAC
jgi:hypothetical protein